MLDSYIDGQVSRISPEAPVPIVHVKERIEHLGGAGNAAANIVSLGAKPILVSKVGKDDAYKTIKKIFKEKKLDGKNLLVTKEPTITKTRITSRGQHIVRVDDESPKNLSSADKSELKKILKVVRKETDVVLVSDYAKGMIDQEVLDMVKDIWKSGIVLVDPKPRKEIDYSDVDLITPNFKEACELLDEKYENTDEDAEELLKKLAKKFKLNSVLLTRSEEGASLFSKDKNAKAEILHKKVKNVKEVRDVSGAGDTVIAMIAIGLATDLDFDDLVTISNKAASIVVSKAGTVTVTWTEITEALRKDGHFPDFMFR